MLPAPLPPSGLQVQAARLTLLFLLDKVHLHPHAYARDAGACSHSTPHSSLPVPFAAHTGYQTGKHSGNGSHSLSRQQGEEQHDLALPAQNETGKQLPGPGGRGKLGQDTRRDDEAPMWGPGRTPAVPHVHTTRLCWAARAARPSQEGPGGKAGGSDTLGREPPERAATLAF